MKNKIMITLVIILVLVIAVIACFYGRNNLDNIFDNDTVFNEDNNKKLEEFVVDLKEEEDHYILTIQTNIINKPFEFNYDNKNFLLDTSSNVFDNAIIEDGATESKRVSVQLESNKVYKIYFIKKSNAKLKLENNLIIMN